MHLYRGQELRRNIDNLFFVVYGNGFRNDRNESERVPMGCFPIIAQPSHLVETKRRRGDVDQGEHHCIFRFR